MKVAELFPLNVYLFTKIAITRINDFYVKELEGRHITVLQIKRGHEDNAGINSPVSQWKYMV